MSSEKPPEGRTTLLDEIQESVLIGDGDRVRPLTEQALGEGIAPLAVFHEALVPAMDTVGRKMQSNEYYLPEVIMAARAMKVALEILKPFLAESEQIDSRGTVVVGTVKGDLHDIGKNLLILFLGGAGFHVVDLGTDVDAARFLDAAVQERADIVAMSALLTTTMLGMKDVIATLAQAGVRNRVKVLVGGASVTERFAREIGADGYGRDAAAGVELAKRWMDARGSPEQF